MKPNDHTPATAVSYDPIAVSVESTVVAEYIPDPHEETTYQSEAALEAELIRVLQSQAYEYLPIRSEADLIGNLRTQLELLNGFQFSDAEWDRFFTTCIAGKNDGITEKTVRIHEDNVQLLRRDDGTTKNVLLIDQRRIHNNRLQVINQYEIGQGEGGARYSNRYDVTILVNGLPLVHIELKRRGVDIREAFNQIDRYQRDSFWAGSGLFEYVQLFVISNGTLTKYYSNTVRLQHITENQGTRRQVAAANARSYEFTMWWTDAANNQIPDLTDFAATFLAKRTILAILTRYCVLNTRGELLVMRPYQIVAAEKMLQRIEIATNYKKLGTIDAGGYVWHTTGSGKTLTSFKAAQLATQMDSVDKVLFVVDRKDLDYQTMREYDRFQKGAANSNTSTAVLKRQLESRDAKIIITTIQKLSTFIKANPSHDVYRQHVVIIFDECHRSQFGDMHTAITKAFKRYNLFGFTGTPIFAINAASGGNPRLKTTEQAFGDKLHTYTIVDAITDKNVLPFRIDYVSTVQVGSVTDKQVSAIDTERALLDPEPNTKVTLETIAAEDYNSFEQSAFQAIAFKRQKSYVRKPAIDVKLHIEPLKLFKQHLFAETPFYNEPAMLYTIVEGDEPAEAPVSEIDADKLKTEMLSKAAIQKMKQDARSAKGTVSATGKHAHHDRKTNEPFVVDLHAHEILETTQGMDSLDILQYQLEVFRRTLKEHANERGLKIVFIHGKGEGVLRKAIINELNRHFKGYTYQDASFQEYGYGATLVKIG